MIVCGLLAFILSTPKEIQDTIDAFVSKAPGVVVIVGTVDHGVEHIYKAGTPPAGAPALDENTEFEIGSITKTFTATLLAQMVGAGEVKLDDPVASDLPGVTVPSYQGKTITLETLADQHSGFPESWIAELHPKAPNDPFDDFTDADAAKALETYQLTRAPGAQYEYSNFGVSLLGEALANRAKEPYAALLENRVLQPLGMSDTTFDPNAAQSARVMPGFDQLLQPMPSWHGSFIAPAGLLRSTERDMLHYIEANLAAPQGVLGNAMALAQTPRDTTSATLPFLKIGLIWQINTRLGFIWHNGQTGGYHSFVGFEPQQQTGVVVLTNVASFSVDQLAENIFGLGIAAPAGPTKMTVSGPYGGVYPLSPAFAIKIFEQGGKLYGQATGQQPFMLTLISGTTYAVAGVDAKITFQEDAKGHVTGLILHQNGMDLPAPRNPQ